MDSMVAVPGLTTMGGSRPARVVHNRILGQVLSSRGWESLGMIPRRKKKFISRDQLELALDPIVRDWSVPQILEAAEMYGQMSSHLQGLAAARVLFQEIDAPAAAWTFPPTPADRGLATN
jgi:hypothetical protein